MFLKYGKIKCQAQFSNLFGTTVQLVIRLKPLMEKQFSFYELYPKSKIIPAVIDAHEQLNGKQEYLDINPFIHSFNQAIISNNDINFVDFFYTVLNLIDPLDADKKELNDKPIIFTSLRNLQNLTKIKSYLFEISFEKDQKLSKIIENKYYFSSDVLNEPQFLFFYPNNNGQNEIEFDDIIHLKNFNKLCLYTLSIIVVKKIEKKDLNRFVLFIGFNSWTRIEDEEIKSMTKNAVFKEISNQKVYRIELFGFCFEPFKNIVSDDFSESTKVEYHENGKDDKETSKISNSI